MKFVLSTQICRQRYIHICSGVLKRQIYIKAMVSLELVSRILGHASTQTTGIYARPSIEMLKEAMEKSPYLSPGEKALWRDDEDELAKLCGLR